MKYSVLTTLLIVFSLSLYAQPKEIKFELEDVYAQYQNAYNNSARSMKMIMNGVNNSVNLMDARVYASNAGKYAGDAMNYTKRAIEGAEAAAQRIGHYSCKGDAKELNRMVEIFQSAEEDFNTVYANLKDASQLKELDKIGQSYVQAMPILQYASKKLNKAMEQMNLAIADMKGCELKQASLK